MQMTPVLARANVENGLTTDAEHLAYGAERSAFLEKLPDCFHVLLGKFRPPVSFSLHRTKEPNSICVFGILRVRHPLQIRKAIVVFFPILVVWNHSLWALAAKGFQYQLVDLALKYFPSFGEADLQISTNSTGRENPR